MYRLCWERKIYVGTKFNLINTADKLLLLLMVAAVMRHLVITVTSNNTGIKWKRMNIWGHRRHDWKRPQSKQNSFINWGAHYPHPPYSSFLNSPLLFLHLFIAFFCYKHGFLLIFHCKTWPQIFGPSWHASARQSPVALATDLVAHPGWWGTGALIQVLVVERAPGLTPEHMQASLFPSLLHLHLTLEQHVTVSQRHKERYKKVQRDTLLVSQYRDWIREKEIKITG